MSSCSICSNDYLEEQSYTLPNCLHTFCKPCLVSIFEKKILDLQIDFSDFTCPQCQMIFNPDNLQSFLPKLIYDKYCELALRHNKIQGLEDYEVLIDCLNKTCKEKMVIWNYCEYFTCPAFKVKFCRRCQLEYHKGLTCQEQQRAIKKNKEFGCQCPNCKNFCEKIKGCNFMDCKCKKYFCFLCEQKLEEKDHYSHFTNNDPVNGLCRILYNGNWMDPEMAIELQYANRFPVNPIPCPNCGNKSSDLSQLIIDEKYVLCKSVKCKGLVYCLLCKQGIPLNNLPNHFATDSTKCKYQ